MSHRLRGALRRRGAQAAIGSLVVTGTLAGVGVASSAQDETINASASTWEPADVAIETGDSVTWSMDTSNVPHNLVASDGEENDPAWTGQKIPIQVGGTFTYRFTKPGLYAFLCEVHPSTMRGTVTSPATRSTRRRRPRAPGADADRDSADGDADADPDGSTRAAPARRPHHDAARRPAARLATDTAPGDLRAWRSSAAAGARVTLLASPRRRR